MRKLGIVGGMSWASTALYYEHINRGIAQRLGGLHSARLVIESLDLAPVARMELSGDWDGVARLTLEAAKHLEAAGAEAVIITSNTGHKVYEAVAANIGVPMLHIGDATADRLVADSRKNVALLGTRFTMLEQHVRSRLESRGISRLQSSARGQRNLPRPTRSASTTAVSPESLPENRLGFGSTAGFLNGVTRR